MAIAVRGQNPVVLSQHDYWALFPDPAPPVESAAPPCDSTWDYPAQLGQGYYREIQLRDGLDLAIAHYQLHRPVTIQLPEREHPLEYSFLVSGAMNAVRAGQYALCGSGIAPIETTEFFAAEPIVEVNVHLEPSVFRAFWHMPPDLLPPGLDRLLPATPQRYCIRSGAATAAMQMAVQQILQCPFHGITQRIYLESKVWELLGLLIEQEREPPDPSKPHALHPDDIDRIHHAKDVLLQQLDNPPSLLELARQVGLNDCTLKRGFRQVFGTTAFGYLHEHRLEQARRLLEEQRLNVSEVAQTIGFASRSYFAAAFRKKFGVTPKQYLLRHRNSA